VKPNEFEMTDDHERNDASVCIISFFEGLKSLHEGNLYHAEACFWLADMDGPALDDEL